MWRKNTTIKNKLGSSVYKPLRCVRYNPLGDTYDAVGIVTGNTHLSLSREVIERYYVEQTNEANP